jgi:hypothetical protein
MVYHNVRLMAVGIVLLALSACAGAVTKGYTGPTLPADQTALIRSGPYTHIEKCDGLNVPGLNVAVLPGVHTVEMRPAEQEQPLRNYIFYSRVNGSVSFTAEAGHRYLAYVDFVPGQTPADEEKGSGYTWIGYISDESSEKKVGNTGSLPLGVEPRTFQGGWSSFSSH